MAPGARSPRYESAVEVPIPADVSAPPSAGGTAPAGGRIMRAVAREVGKPALAQERSAERAPLLVYTAQLTMATFEIAVGLGRAEAVARELGGFLARRTNNALIIRVPAARFDEALDRLEKLGDVTNRQVDAEDITEEFLDLEVRLKNSRAIRERLEQLLSRASKVEDSIAIEKELERVASEMERLEGRLKYLKDRAQFSTITVTFEARAAERVAKGTFRLPFPWLDELGLGRLLRLDQP